MVDRASNKGRATSQAVRPQDPVGRTRRVVEKGRNRVEEINKSVPRAQVDKDPIKIVVHKTDLEDRVGNNDQIKIEVDKTGLADRVDNNDQIRTPIITAGIKNNKGLKQTSGF